MPHTLAEVRPATASDLEDALALLTTSRLPTAGVAEHFPARFVVVRDPETGALAGMAGVEVHGSAGLLRSVAVRDSERGRGLGQVLSRAAVELARRSGVRDLYLLTTTAESFFPRLGFERVGRDELPDALNASEEMRGACPASAVAMRLRLS